MPRETRRCVLFSLGGAAKHRTAYAPRSLGGLSYMEAARTLFATHHATVSVRAVFREACTRYLSMNDSRIVLVEGHLVRIVWLQASLAHFPRDGLQAPRQRRCGSIKIHMPRVVVEHSPNEGQGNARKVGGGRGASSGLVVRDRGVVFEYWGIPTPLRIVTRDERMHTHSQPSRAEPAVRVHPAPVARDPQSGIELAPFPARLRASPEMLDSTLEGPCPSYVVALHEVPQQRLLLLLRHKSFEHGEARHDHAGRLRGAAQPFSGLRHVWLGETDGVVCPTAGLRRVSFLRGGCSRAGCVAVSFVLDTDIPLSFAAFT